MVVREALHQPCCPEVISKFQRALPGVEAALQSNNPRILGIARWGFRFFLYVHPPESYSDSLELPDSFLNPGCALPVPSLKSWNRLRQVKA